MSAAAQETVLIRSEDAEHPKLIRLRRAVNVVVGKAGAVERPWVVWAAGLSRGWLMETLDAGGQVLVIPPWTDGGFAGLPPARVVAAPRGELVLEEVSYAVSATSAIEPSPTWQAHGLFRDSRLAWLVSHEPFVGAGQAWLATAELLVASPSTRPRDSKQLTAAIVKYLAKYCRVPEAATITGKGDRGIDSPEFSAADVPYLLAATGLSKDADLETVAGFVVRRLGVEPDMEHVHRIMNHPMVAADLLQPIGAREHLARTIDGLGFRSFRLEIEETT